MGMWGSIKSSFTLVLSYEVRIYCRALKDTYNFFGLNKQSLAVPVLWVFGLAVYFVWQGLDKAKEELIVALAFGFIPIGVFTVLLMVWNIFIAPSKADKFLREENISLHGVLKNKSHSLEVADYLMNAWNLAEHLATKAVENKASAQLDWVNESTKWFDDVKQLLDNHLPADEAYAFKTITVSGLVGAGSYLQERERMKARMGKLRLITARYLKPKEDS